MAKPTERCSYEMVVDGLVMYSCFISQSSLLSLRKDRAHKILHEPETIFEVFSRFSSYGRTYVVTLNLGMACRL